MSDAIRILTEDHRRVEQLFAEYSSTLDPKIAEQICQELTVHAEVEETLIYPLLSELPSGEETQENAEAEHNEAKELIAQIQAAGFDNDQEVERFVKQLEQSVAVHVDKEETTVFPSMRKTLGDERLTELGQQLAEAKQKMS